MALPININDLLNKQKVESDRIEFKKGWNPTSIYHSICAFANDIDNLGGGYILVGVEEENGMAVRPVNGLPIEQLDKIQKDIVGYNNLIAPYYEPRISVEEVDGVNILAIWVPSGTKRPYTVPEDITAKRKTWTHYVRYGTSSIEAKGERLEELRDLAKKDPFDERGNNDIKPEDISLLQIREYLRRVSSRLAESAEQMSVMSLLDQMDLLTGPTEHRSIKNAAAMMFCDHMERFFRTSQVEIVIFPEGREENPNNLIEAPVIRGTVPQMISEALNYLRVNIVKERIIKPKDDEKSIRFFNYPYQALEEAVVNALYHRDYQTREPVEITVEPHRISILSFCGPDRSIPMSEIQTAHTLRARRYRNRRLGDFLKELGLTEGRATGIPTIQRTLKANGSPEAIITTDEDRSYFLIDIPCHSGFEGENVFGSQSEQKDEQKDEQKELTERQSIIIKELGANMSITLPELAQKTSIKYATLRREIEFLQKEGYITREGGRKSGQWIIKMI